MYVCACVRCARISYQVNYVHVDIKSDSNQLTPLATVLQYANVDIPKLGTYQRRQPIVNRADLGGKQ